MKICLKEVKSSIFHYNILKKKQVCSCISFVYEGLDKVRGVLEDGYLIENNVISHFMEKEVDPTTFLFSDGSTKQTQKKVDIRNHQRERIKNEQMTTFKKNSNKMVAGNTYC